MTLRERIADWLTGGMLTKQAADYLAWGNQRHEDYLRCFWALEDIAACETPGANGTVRRMAKIAREAME